LLVSVLLSKLSTESTVAKFVFFASIQAHRFHNAISVTVEAIIDLTVALLPEAWILHGGVSLHLGPDAVGLCTEEAFLGVEPGDFPVGNPRIRRLQLALNLLPYRLKKRRKTPIEKVCRL
jgi:hypothetical protein